MARIATALGNITMKTGLGREITESRLFGPHMLEAPYPVYRELQQERPVFWDDRMHAWIVSRHADVTAILKDQRMSSERVAPVVAARYPDPKYAPLFDTLARTMVNLDDPDHARLRKLVHYAFQRTEVARWEPRVREIVDSLIDSMLAKAAGLSESVTPLPGDHGNNPATNPLSIDFVSEFAVPLPIQVISELIGIPVEERDQVKAWCDDFAQVALNFYSHLTQEQLDQGLESVSAFRNYIAEKAAWYRAHPPAEPYHPDGWSDRLAEGETLFAHLVHAEQDEHKLDVDELLANTLLLLSAGNETTTSLLANGLLALLQNPDQMALLRADPSLIPDAIDEFLRFDPPVQFLGRLAKEDIELHGETIKKGELVVVIMGAANHDPEVLDDPDRLDVTRYQPKLGVSHGSGCPVKQAHHLAFGHGRHLCSGMQLAKLEAQIGFERLLARTASIDLGAEQIQHRANFNMRCPTRLTVRLSALDPSSTK